MAPEGDPPTAAAKDDYIFSRDFLDINRMNLLHSLWVKNFGYVIHPNIPKDSHDLRVADLGTGTGIWLLDAHDLVAASARLEGFDISLASAPPADTLPSNVTFRHLDVKGDLPDDLVGVFDIVHLRFLSFVLLNDQIPAAVERIFKMLSWWPLPYTLYNTIKAADFQNALLIEWISEPGGYIQWGEFDFETVRTEKTKPENNTEALTELHGLFSIQDPRVRPTWITHLPTTLSAAGFVQVEAGKSDPPPHKAFVQHECGLMMYEAFCRKTQNEKLRQQLTRLLPLAVEETRKGAYTTAVYWTVIARRPASEP